MTTEEIISDIKKRIKYTVPATFDSNRFKSVGKTQNPIISLQNVDLKKDQTHSYKMENFEQAIEILNAIKPGIDQNQFTADKSKDLFICLEIK